MRENIILDKIKEDIEANRLVSAQKELEYLLHLVKKEIHFQCGFRTL